MQSRLKTERKQREREAEIEAARESNERIAAEVASAEAAAAARKQRMISDMQTYNQSRIDELRRRKEEELAAKKRELESQSDFAYSEVQHHGDGESAARRRQAYRAEVEAQIAARMKAK